jgi:hypothetical protein
MNKYQYTKQFYVIKDNVVHDIVDANEISDIESLPEKFWHDDVAHVNHVKYKRVVVKKAEIDENLICELRDKLSEMLSYYDENIFVYDYDEYYCYTQCLFCHERPYYQGSAEPIKHDQNCIGIRLQNAFDKSRKL